MAVLALLLLGMSPAGAAEPQSGVLRIGTPGDYAPYAWFDVATGTYRGADIALARALALRLGRRAEFVGTTWASLVPDAEAGRFDIAVGGISITPERAQRVAFSRALSHDRKLPVVRCGEERRYDSRQRINRAQVRLIVNRGGTNERFAREKFPDASLTVHADNRTVFEEIRAGRADVMVTDAVEGRLQQRAASGLCVAKVKEQWAPASKAVLIAARDLQVPVAAALAEMQARSYARELAAWESYGWSMADAPDMQLAALVDERLALAVEVARSKWNSGAAVEDVAREQALLASMREQGQQLGVPEAITTEFFRAQIEASKILQRELHAKWRRQAQRPFADVADLATALRPQIDRLNARMLVLLAARTGKVSRWQEVSTMSLVSPAAVKTARELKARAPSR